MDTSLLQRAPKRIALTVTVAVGLAITPLMAIHTDAADPGGITRPTAGAQGRADAVFEGRQLDLTDDWGDARACWVDELGHASCFRSEREMDRAIVSAGRHVDRTSQRGSLTKTSSTSRIGLRSGSCSSSIRLYSNNWYVGYTLYLTQRNTWINLSWYGFDDVISSYRIGACNSTFRSGSNGTGSTYWGGTNAYNSRSSMSGWNNVLSSVHIS